PPAHRCQSAGASSWSIRPRTRARSDSTELPVPPELVERIGRADVDQATADLAGDVESGRLGTAHRAVLINLVARIDPGALPEVARSLDAVEPMAPGHPLASVLSDLARVRGRMLHELAPAD
ncbi:MAG: hypothetical protein AAGF91_01730, partial [Actinomycetota bacterium]